MAIDLENYVTVAERITTFYNRHPDGVLNRLHPRTGELVPMEFVSYAGADWVIYTAFAYRNADDQNPGVGTAWERIPGTTPYTKGSEIQNAETSAWGRAIIAVGSADAIHGIASREEVQLAEARQSDLPPRGWYQEADVLYTSAELAQKWQEANRTFGRKKTPEQTQILEYIASLGKAAKDREAAEAEVAAEIKAQAKASIESAFAHDEAGEAEIS